MSEKKKILEEQEEVCGPRDVKGQAELTNYVTDARIVVLLGIDRSLNLPDYVKPLAKAVVDPLFSALGQAIGGFELAVRRTERLAPSDPSGNENQPVALSSPKSNKKKEDSGKP